MDDGESLPSWELLLWLQLRLRLLLVCRLSDLRPGLRLRLWLRLSSLLSWLSARLS